MPEVKENLIPSQIYGKLGGKEIRESLGTRYNCGKKSYEYKAGQEEKKEKYKECCWDRSDTKTLIRRRKENKFDQDCFGKSKLGAGDRVMLDRFWTRNVAKKEGNNLAQARSLLTCLS